jgi:hypothetical protein
MEAKKLGVMKCERRFKIKGSANGKVTPDRQAYHSLGPEMNTWKAPPNHQGRHPETLNSGPGNLW